MGRCAVSLRNVLSGWPAPSRQNSLSLRQEACPQYDLPSLSQCLYYTLNLSLGGVFVLGSDDIFILGLCPLALADVFAFID